MPAILAGALGACAPVEMPPTLPEPYGCPLAGEQRMRVAELFFGGSIPGRGPLTEAEWADFAARTLTRNFPDGFTVVDGEGQWRDPQTGRIAREKTKILLVATKRAPDLAPRLAAVIETYKARFRQQSVGMITRDSCAAF